MPKIQPKHLGLGQWEGNPEDWKPKTPVSAESKRYIEKRNKLIPYAVAHADRKAGNPCPVGLTHEQLGIKWNQAFLGKMNELAEKVGLKRRDALEAPKVI